MNPYCQEEVSTLFLVNKHAVSKRLGKRGILFTVNRTKTHKWATRVSDQVKKG